MKNTLPGNPNKKINYRESQLKEIWLAGGCFWGVEAYMSRVFGVADAVSGYANGRTENPSYEDICYKDTGYAETVYVSYDPEKVSLLEILEHFFKIIDPTSLNRQGGDSGTQYRTGIYYKNAEDIAAIKTVVAKEQNKYDKPIVTEVLPLSNFYKAEEYHQDYLDKNPNGYCHVDFSTLNEEQKPQIDSKRYKKPRGDVIRKKLTQIQYDVTQQNGTEPPFNNAYWQNNEPGIYVDVVTGEPLFSSSDKFDSGCGWPSFTKPIEGETVNSKKDISHGMIREEARSKIGDSHLGHIFDDGPRDKGGKRYCINSSAIRFIPLSQMEEEGYGEWMLRIRE